MTSPSTTVSLRFGVGGSRTVHLSSWIADRGFQRSHCNLGVGHFLGATSKKVDGRSVGTSAIKLCRRCVHPNQAAVCDGIIAFFAWAGRLPLEPISRDQLVPVGAGDRLGQLDAGGGEDVAAGHEITIATLARSGHVNPTSEVLTAVDGGAVSP